MPESVVTFPPDQVGYARISALIIINLIIFCQAFPDIAAQGRRFRVWFQNATISVSGTSASSPTAAGIFALLNDARLTKGLPTLGFVNPLLYKDKISATFNDITEGNNPGCGTPGFNVSAWWSVILLWTDMTTGYQRLGS